MVGQSSENGLARDMINILKTNTKTNIPVTIATITKSSIHVTLFSYDASILTQFTEFTRRAGLCMGFIVPNAHALKNRTTKWSVLASPHVHKTTWSQFERRTKSRLVTIGNAHPDLVEKYLWYIQYHLPSTIWMNARVYHYDNNEQNQPEIK